MEYLVGFSVFVGVPLVGGALFVRRDGDISGWLGAGMILGPIAGYITHLNTCL